MEALLRGARSRWLAMTGVGPHQVGTYDLKRHASTHDWIDTSVGSPKRRSDVFRRARIEFKLMHSVGSDSQGNLFVTETGGMPCRVQKFRRVG